MASAAQERSKKLLARLGRDADPVAVKSSLKHLSGKHTSVELDIDSVHPNGWNPNVLEGAQFKKLRNGIQLLFDQGVRPPPIVVREAPSGGYEIIDGEHRWRVFRDLKQTTIPGYVLNVDDKTARILTDTFNYLRGAPDEQKYSELTADLVKSFGATLDELADLLPESKDELQEILAQSDMGLKALLMLDEQEKAALQDAEELTDESTWLDVTFRMSKAQARIVEKEVDRIEETLEGKNRRGRALEYMAVMSSQTPLAQQVGVGEKRKKGKKKGKKKEEEDDIPF